MNGKDMLNFEVFPRRPHLRDNVNSCAPPPRANAGRPWPRNPNPPRNPPREPSPGHGQARGRRAPPSGRAPLGQGSASAAQEARRPQGRRQGRLAWSTAGQEASAPERCGRTTPKSKASAKPKLPVARRQRQHRRSSPRLPRSPTPKQAHAAGKPGRTGHACEGGEPPGKLSAGEIAARLSARRTREGARRGQG